LSRAPLALPVTVRGADGAEWSTVTRLLAALALAYHRRR
jgi:hypothetical protein